MFGFGNGELGEEGFLLGARLDDFSCGGGFWEVEEIDVFFWICLGGNWLFD